ncbi:MAG TPA: LL-diaminopimelate aminotransferase [Chloroflexia bacterium]|nr:LL-diaminopimelate aminotransferase [Chloroflexia bacterium]
MKLADRINNLPPYVFASLAKRIADRRARGDQVINFGMGDPDLPMPPALVDALCTAAHDPQTHRYPNYFGLPELRRAIAGWYCDRFRVELNPETEVLPLIGSKEGIAHIALAFCDPGDRVLVPNPGYPVYRYGTLLAGGEVCEMPLLEAHGFLPDFDALDRTLPAGVTMMWLNYPNNPTGAVADLEFFARAVAFARRHEIIICHDNPYSEICFGDYRAPSILQVPGAREVAVEFHSLSKTYNMAGMRIGMVVGNAQAVEALGRIKSNVDSGVPSIVQQTALAALTQDQAWIAARNAVYERRRDRLVPALNAAGIAAPLPQGSLYVWGKTPAGLSAAAFADRLFEEAAIVVTPGSSFGSCGEGYFRLSLTVPDAEVETAVARLAQLRF